MHTEIITQTRLLKDISTQGLPHEVIRLLLTEFREKLGVLRTEKKQATLADLPPDLHELVLIFPDDFENFHLLINFLVRGLHADGSEQIKVLRELTKVLGDFYDKVIAILKLTTDKEGLLLVQEAKLILAVFYRMYSKQTLQRAIQEYRGGNNQNIELHYKIYMAAIRLLVIYNPDYAMGVSYQGEIIARQAAERSLVFDSLQSKRLRIPHTVEKGPLAEYQAFMRAAATVFICKTEKTERLLQEDNPISIVLGIAREGVQHTRNKILSDWDTMQGVEVGFISPEESEPNPYKKYTKEPVLTSPLEAMNITLLRNKGKFGLYMTDILSLSNAASHLYKILFDTQIRSSVETDDEDQQKVDGPLLGFMYRLLELRLFCEYSILAQEFSFQNVFYITSILKDACELAQETGKITKDIVEFRFVLNRIIEYVKRKRDFLNTHAIRPESVSRELEYYTRAVAVLEQVNGYKFEP